MRPADCAKSEPAQTECRVLAAYITLLSRSINKRRYGRLKLPIRLKAP